MQSSVCMLWGGLWFCFWTQTCKSFHSFDAASPRLIPEHMDLLSCSVFINKRITQTTIKKHGRFAKHVLVWCLRQYSYQHILHWPDASLASVYCLYLYSYCKHAMYWSRVKVASMSSQEQSVHLTFAVFKCGCVDQLVQLLQIQEESKKVWKFIIDREIEAPARFQAIQSYRCAISISGLQFLVSPYGCAVRISVLQLLVLLYACVAGVEPCRCQYTGLHQFFACPSGTFSVRHALNMQLCKDMYMWLSQPPSCYYSRRISQLQSWLFAYNRMIPTRHPSELCRCHCHLDSSHVFSWQSQLCFTHTWPWLAVIVIIVAV